MYWAKVLVKEALQCPDMFFVRPIIGGLDEKSLWKQILSLGEQQRLAISQVILLKPAWKV